MMNITLPKSEQDKFRSWVRKQTTETKRDCQKIIYDSAVKMHNLVVRQSPVDYGRLRASAHMVLSSDRMGAMIYMGVKYAPYREFGTGKFVRVYPGYETYAYQFKGRGIRKVNSHPHPYFINSFELTKKFMIKELNKKGFK